MHWSCESRLHVGHTYVGRVPVSHANGSEISHEKHLHPESCLQMAACDAFASFGLVWAENARETFLLPATRTRVYQKWTFDLGIPEPYNSLAYTFPVLMLSPLNRVKYGGCHAVPSDVPFLWRTPVALRITDQAAPTS